MSANMNEMIEAIPHLEALALRLGVSDDYQNHLRKIAFRTIERMWRWNWCAAALNGGTLKPYDMLSDLVTDALILVAERGEDDPMQDISDVVPAWSSRLYEQSDVYYKGWGVNRRAYVATSWEVDEGVSHIERQYKPNEDITRMLDKLSAEQDVARLRPQLTDEEWHRITVMSECDTLSEAADRLGCHEKTAFRWRREIRDKLGGKVMLPSKRLPAKPFVQKPCSIETCDNPLQARGWCRMHYQRWRSTGDPLLKKKLGRKPKMSH